MAKKEYAFKIYTGPLVASGSRMAHSKLDLLNMLKEEFPHIPRKDIIIWDPSKKDNPQTLIKRKGINVQSDGSGVKPPKDFKFDTSY